MKDSITLTVICDEATDSAVMEQLMIYVRYEQCFIFRVVYNIVE